MKSGLYLRYRLDRHRVRDYYTKLIVSKEKVRVAPIRDKDDLKKKRRIEEFSDSNKSGKE
jgi:hypothetical protein